MVKVCRWLWTSGWIMDRVEGRWVGGDGGGKTRVCGVGMTYPSSYTDILLVQACTALALAWTSIYIYLPSDLPSPLPLYRRALHWLWPGPASTCPGCSSGTCRADLEEGWEVAEEEGAAGQWGPLSWRSWWSTGGRCVEGGGGRGQVYTGCGRGGEQACAARDNGSSRPLSPNQRCQPTLLAIHGMDSFSPSPPPHRPPVCLSGRLCRLATPSVWPLPVLPVPPPPPRIPWDPPSRAARWLPAINPLPHPRQIASSGRASGKLCQPGLCSYCPYRPLLLGPPGLPPGGW